MEINIYELSQQDKVESNLELEHLDVRSYIYGKSRVLKVRLEKCPKDMLIEVGIRCSRLTSGF